MRLLVSALAFALSVPAFAQGQLTTANPNVSRTEGGFQVTAPSIEMRADAVSIALDRVAGCATVLRLSGDVEVRFSGAVVHADQAEYRCSGDVEVWTRGIHLTLSAMGVQ